MWLGSRDRRAHIVPLENRERFGSAAGDHHRLESKKHRRELLASLGFAQDRCDARPRERDERSILASGEPIQLRRGFVATRDFLDRGRADWFAAETAHQVGDFRASAAFEQRDRQAAQGEASLHA
jgi:hypothetical protein